MKFDNLKFEEEKKYNKSQNKKSILEVEYSNIEKTYRYDNVSVLLMKKGTKGNFRLLSTLVNDGEYPCSWLIRIHYTKNSWSINVAPHDTIDKNKYDINLYEYFQSLSEEMNTVSYLGYKTYICFDKIKNKGIVEKIVNFIILKLKDVRLEILHPVLHLDFKKDNNLKDFRIKSTYLNYDDEEVSSSVYEKYLTIIKHILSEATLEEKVIIEKIGNRLIKEKKLPFENKEYLDTLSEKYISQQQRISISLRNLMENRLDDD